MKSGLMEVALFDLGGVLVELTGVSTLLSWTGGQMEPEEIWRHWLTSPSVRAFETGAMEPEDFADLLVAELDLPVQRAEFGPADFSQGPWNSSAKYRDRLYVQHYRIQTVCIGLG
jgi:hypothetical protein